MLEENVAARDTYNKRLDAISAKLTQLVDLLLEFKKDVTEMKEEVKELRRAVLHYSGSDVEDDDKEDSYWKHHSVAEPASLDNMLAKVTQVFDLMAEFKKDRTKLMGEVKELRRVLLNHSSSDDEEDSDDEAGGLSDGEDDAGDEMYMDSIEKSLGRSQKHCSVAEPVSLDYILAKVTQALDLTAEMKDMREVLAGIKELRALLYHIGSDDEEDSDEEVSDSSNVEDGDGDDEEDSDEEASDSSNVEDGDGGDGDGDGDEMDTDAKDHD